MARIFIDNIPYEVKDGQNLLHACLSLGFDIPYFCWHPALHSVGACRQCAVKQFRDETDTRGKIVMSCMTPAADGTRISIDDPDVKAFRRGVIEWLMTNHPHDCPVCDEGGECHLQDMTVLTEHDYRRFRFRKRTYRNQDLGPFLNHEMNRCIQCYRCVRFYRDHAGGRDLDAFASHNHVYFGRHHDGRLENIFSGNLAEVCPTGVFTDKTFRRHYARKWDLQTAPSICVHCGIGCNTIVSERTGLVRRIQNRYHHEINGYFICDRGRYGYGFVNSPGRIRTPMLRLRRDAEPQASTREELIERLGSVLHFGARVIGIGSPRASVEANFCLRTLVGPERFFSGIGRLEQRLIGLIINLLGACRTASLRDAEESDAVLILGEDVANTAPRLALSLIQASRNRPMEVCSRLRIPHWNAAAVQNAIQDGRGPFFIASAGRTALEDVASGVLHAAPDDIAILGYAVAGAIGRADASSDLPGHLSSAARDIASSLLSAARPLIVSGTGCLSEDVILSAFSVAAALRRAGRDPAVAFVLPEVNSMGLCMMTERHIQDAVEAVRGGSADTVIILENDLYRRTWRSEADELLGLARHVILLEHSSTPTVERADIVIPVGTYAESQGTFVNSEGRAQRAFKVFMPEGETRESWRWLTDMIEISGRPEGKRWRSIDHVVKAIPESIPAFRDLPQTAPGSGFRVSGLRIPRQPHRMSGRTAISAHIDVHEPRPPVDSDSPFAFSMEGYEGMPPSPLTQRYWRPGWNSVQALNRFQQEVGGPLRGGDPGIRLIVPSREKEADFDEEMPQPFLPAGEEFLILPLYHIFGSEELSGMADCIAGLSPRPYIGMNREDASGIGLSEGDVAEVTAERYRGLFGVKMCEGLPKGTAGMSAGLAGEDWIGLPLRARIVKKDGGDD